MDLSKAVRDNMRFVEAVRSSVFPHVAKDHVRAATVEDDGFDCIEFGGYNFYPVEETIASIAGPRPVIRWNMSAWVVVDNAPHSPDDLDEKELGQFDNIADCLAEIGRIEYERKIDEVGLGLVMADIGEDDVYSQLEEMQKDRNAKCPHGLDYAECNACMIASDLAYDANRDGKRA